MSSNTNGSTLLTWLPFIVLGSGVAIVVLFVASLFLPSWPPAVLCHGDGCKEAREWITSSVTFLVILGGLFQYLRAQVWKRAEFVAAQMTTFFGSHAVKNSMLMIDWTKRRIDLFDAPKDPLTWPVVTRTLQSRALLAHTVAHLVPKIAISPHGSTSKLNTDHTSDSAGAEYTPVESAIRDSYDAWLDGLELFASYVATGLVTVRDLRPYLRYWVEDIVSKSQNVEEDTWTASLLTYIAFYKFEGVQAMFGAFGYKISPGSDLYAYFLDRVPQGPMAAALRSVDNILRVRKE